MSKQFVTLNKDDFINWANSTFGIDNFQTTTHKQGVEMVIRHDLNIFGLEIHVYTTIDPKELDNTRPKGEDAIRILLFDRFAGKLAHQEPKILRVESNKSTVFDRLTERVSHAISVAKELQQGNRFCDCSQNRVHKVPRVNSRTGQSFYGCSLFPLCKEAGFNKLKNAAQKYPLALNIFQSENPAPQPDIHYEKPELLETIHWDVDEKMELVPTKTWTHAKYPFDYFNYVQSTVYNSQAWNRDCNLILGTATSSGKTICAELVIAQILYGEKQ